MKEVSRASPRWWSWLLLLCPPLAGLVGIWNYYRSRAMKRRWEEEELQVKAKL
jgi:dephospho-CoA kinase